MDMMSTRLCKQGDVTQNKGKVVIVNLLKIPKLDLGLKSTS